MGSVIEFYGPYSERPMARIESEMVPPVDSFISIRGQTYKVWAVTYALDRAGEHDQSMRASVDIRPYSHKDGGA